MQIFIDHISYVMATLLAGVLIGWSTYPSYARLRRRIAGSDRATERESRHDPRGSGRGERGRGR